MPLTNRVPKVLAFAYELVAHGVPVFAGEPSRTGEGDREFYFPKGWPYLEADEENLKPWRRGWSLCAVTGIGFDVIDVDPRNGGDVSLNLLETTGSLPTICGEVSTPSGGRHLYVKRSGLRKSTPFMGIDMQAGDDGAKGRGFIYLPGTVRQGRVDKVTRGYDVVKPIDWSALENDDNSRWLSVLKKFYTPTEEELLSFRGPLDRELQSYELEYVVTKAQLVALKVRDAVIGERDTTLFKAAYHMGGLISGSGLPEELGIGLLDLAVNQWGLTEEELEQWAKPKIRSKVGYGKKFPLRVLPEQEV